MIILPVDWVVFPFSDVALVAEETASMVDGEALGETERTFAEALDDILGRSLQRCYVRRC